MKVTLPFAASFQNRKDTADKGEEWSNTDVEDWSTSKKTNLDSSSSEDGHKVDSASNNDFALDGIVQRSHGAMRIMGSLGAGCRPGKCARDCKCCTNSSGNRMLESICHRSGNVCCTCCEKERKRQKSCKPLCSSGYFPAECDDICDYETLEKLETTCKLYCVDGGTNGCMDQCRERPSRCKRYCDDEYIPQDCLDYCISIRPPPLPACVPEMCRVAPPMHCEEYCAEHCNDCKDPFDDISLYDDSDYPSSCDCEQEYIPIDCDDICLPPPPPQTTTLSAPPNYCVQVCLYREQFIPLECKDFCKTLSPPTPPPLPQTTTPAPPNFCVQVCLYRDKYIPSDCRDYCEIVITTCPTEPPCNLTTPSYCPPTSCITEPSIPALNCSDYCESPNIPEECVEECAPTRPLYTPQECLEFCWSNDIPRECTDVCTKEKLVDELCLEICASGGHIPGCCVTICQHMTSAPPVCEEHCKEPIIPEECVDTCWELVRPSECKYFCFTDDIPTVCAEYCNEIRPITPQKCVIYCSVLFYPDECNGICPGCSLGEDTRSCQCAQSLGRHTCRDLNRKWDTRTGEIMTMSRPLSFRSRNSTSNSNKRSNSMMSERALKLQDRNKGLADQASQPEKPDQSAKVDPFRKRNHVPSSPLSNRNKALNTNTKPKHQTLASKEESVGTKRNTKRRKLN